MVDVASTSPEETLRLMAAVLLRHVVDPSSDVFGRLSGATVDALKGRLLEAIAREPLPFVRRRLCHTAGQLATAVIGRGGAWDGLLEFVASFSGAEDPMRRLAALTLLDNLAFYCGAAMAPHAPAIMGLVGPRLEDSNLEVRGMAFDVTANMLLAIPAEDAASPACSGARGRASGLRE